MSQFHGEKSEIMVKVPKSVKNAALESYNMKKRGFCGGHETGWKRAKQLSTKESISIEDLRFMRNWYARHIYTSYPSYKEWSDERKPMDEKYFHKKCGIIAWQIWGGNPALIWVNNKTPLLNKHFKKDYDLIKLR
jgi:hypothetical protein